MSVRKSTGSTTGSQAPALSRYAPTLLTNAQGRPDTGAGLVDQFVGDIRHVELGGIDVVDAEFDGPPQHG
jgi:hypothetical protein